MHVRLSRQPKETLDEIRRRIIEETSAYLTLCLERPELAVRIPIIQAGRGRFPASMSDAFWNPVLLD
ncbi:MAG: hypothetical protein HRF50_05715 [Phycisphaerae bacterium]|jgi:hypothetical protein